MRIEQERITRQKRRGKGKKATGTGGVIMEGIRHD